MAASKRRRRAKHAKRLRKGAGQGERRAAEHQAAVLDRRSSGAAGVMEQRKPRSATRRAAIEDQQ